jgi:hypothetical protein
LWFRVLAILGLSPLKAHRAFHLDQPCSRTVKS